jgi:hypothetical protein
MPVAPRPSWGPTVSSTSPRGAGTRTGSTSNGGVATTSTASPERSRDCRGATAGRAAVRSSLVRSAKHNRECNQQCNDYAKFRSWSHGAVNRVYDDAGNVIETPEHAGDFQRAMSGHVCYAEQALNLAILQRARANLPAQSSRDLVTTPIFGSLFCGGTPVSGGGL